MLNDLGAMLWPKQGYQGGVAGYGLANAIPTEKLRLQEVLAQTRGALGELEKLLYEISARLNGPTPTCTDKAAPPPPGVLGVSVEIRSAVMRLQTISQQIINDL